MLKPIFDQYRIVRIKEESAGLAFSTFDSTSTEWSAIFLPLLKKLSQRCILGKETIK